MYTIREGDAKWRVSQWMDAAKKGTRELFPVIDYALIGQYISFFLSFIPGNSLCCQRARRTISFILFQLYTLLLVYMREQKIIDSFWRHTRSCCFKFSRGDVKKKRNKRKKENYLRLS